MRSSIALKKLLLGWVLIGLVVACGQRDEPDVPPVGALPPVQEFVEPTATPQPTPLAQPQVVISTVEPNTPTPIPTIDVPTPTPNPERYAEIGYTASGEAIQAHRVGEGPHKVVLAADNHPVIGDLLNYFQQNTDQVPADLTVWFLPNINPDGVADVLIDADTGADGCGVNNGVDRMFELAEARALRDFSADSLITILYQPTATTPYLYLDSCNQHAPTATLADLILNSGAIDSGPLRRTVGHFVDYFAGEGIATVSIALPSPAYAFDQQKAALKTAFGNVSAIIGADVRAVGADSVLVDADAFKTTRFTANSFIHPIAIAVTEDGGQQFVLDGGRVIVWDVAAGRFNVLLQSGDYVAETRVLEIIDLALHANTLYALDRAGDVYRYTGDAWALDRYDRAPRDISAHYYTALTTGRDTDEGARFLLESSYNVTLRYTNEAENLWILPEMYKVDVTSAAQDSVYVLLRDTNSSEGTVELLLRGGKVRDFRPNTPIIQPRQIEVSGNNLYVLDRAGRRLLVLDATSGQLAKAYQFADRTVFSAFAVTPTGIDLWTRDAIHHLEQAGGETFVETTVALSGQQPHDPNVLAKLNNLIIPIGIPSFIQRDYQMSGSPRHYRLGVHEGYDFYWQLGSQIQAAAAGTITRADWDYVDDPAQMNMWRGQTSELGYTSPEATDFFCGRQVWIDHGDSIVTRYCHLSSIDPAVQVGAVVEQGQIIARVGNTGTPSSLEGEGADTHLHFELRIGDGYLGQYIRPIEAREWIRLVLR